MNESPDLEIAQRRGWRRTGVVIVGAAAAVAALVLVVTLVARGADQAGPAAAAAAGVIYRGNVLVMETPEHGPRLCAPGARALIGGPDAAPPHPWCQGPANEVVAWDWDAVTAESYDGVTWGTYLLAGTWDGQRFTLTEPARPQDPSVATPATWDEALVDYSPCPEPAGGWRPVDPSKATQAALDELEAWASALPEYAGLWLDQSYMDQYRPPAEGDERWNDPARFVLNLRFVGDPAAWEPRVREYWGGALCLSTAERGLVELNQVQDRVHAEFPGIALTSGFNYMVNAVLVDVLIVTPELREEVDRRYGEGAVSLHGWLEPTG